MSCLTTAYSGSCAATSGLIRSFINCSDTGQILPEYGFDIRYKRKIYNYLD